MRNKLWKGGGRRGKRAYRVVDYVLRPRIVVYVYRHAAQRRYLCRELLQPRVILALALVGLGHFDGVG